MANSNAKIEPAMQNDQDSDNLPDREEAPSAPTYTGYDEAIARMEKGVHPVVAAWTEKHTGKATTNVPDTSPANLQRIRNPENVVALLMDDGKLRRGTFLMSENGQLNPAWSTKFRKTCEQILEADQDVSPLNAKKGALAALAQDPAFTVELLEQEAANFAALPRRSRREALRHPR